MKTKQNAETIAASAPVLGMISAIQYQGQFHLGEGKVCTPDKLVSAIGPVSLRCSWLFCLPHWWLAPQPRRRFIRM